MVELGIEILKLTRQTCCCNSTKLLQTDLTIHAQKHLFSKMHWLQIYIVCTICNDRLVNKIASSSITIWNRLLSYTWHTSEFNLLLHDLYNVKPKALIHSLVCLNQFNEIVTKGDSGTSQIQSFVDKFC